MDYQNSLPPLAFEERLRRSERRLPRKRVASTKVTSAELKELEQTAEKDGKTISEWSREVLLKEARGLKKDPVFTELIAMRLLLNSVLRYVVCGEHMTQVAYNAEMQTIRLTKHKAAEEVMQQYTAAMERPR